MFTYWTIAVFALILTFTPAATLAIASPVHTNSIGIEFQKIPAGTFRMGAHAATACNDVTPAHTVIISKPFYLGACEVTQTQWKRVMDSNPSQFKGGGNPVENVSWEDVQEFIRKLNELEKTDKYRLPTEAEWEYAARAGAESAYCFGEDAAAIVFYAWYNFNSGGTSHPVGMKKVNAFGLHDVHGNVSEWVQDLYGEKYYATSPTTDPAGPTQGVRRVVRGCGWSNGLTACQSAQRFAFESHERRGFIGFRLLREMD
ncbi:formylglycine-generating enzyme family protein [Desulfovibrio sp. OttesenSCG-928-C14]|nr:formylglycine-generating enzyme family protein [Desulfovibrio sp. OttesenSCG-928-C14]